MNRWLPFFLILGSLGTTLLAQAQGTLQGTVTDAQTGAPLPGVNVFIKGTTIGTITDMEGHYQLDVPSFPATVVFSFVGYRSVERQIQEPVARLDVALEPDLLKLEQVVVVGLATATARKQSPNAIGTISARELAEITPASTFDGALYGKVTGVNVTANSGAPGGGITVQLRGVTTINGPSQPLYIVDGVFMDNTAIPGGLDVVTRSTAGGSTQNQDNPVNRIADLNPEDIESVEILKGAAAAAIYGTLASNGVVIINTKQGRPGEFRVQFRQDVGFNRISKRLGMRQFTAETAKEAYGQTGLDYFLEAKSLNRFIDYEMEMYGNTGLISNTYLGLQGGTERTQFYLSGVLKEEEGIIKNTGYTKQSIRANIRHRLSPHATLRVTTNYIHSRADRGLTNNDNAGVSFGIALAFTPNFIDIRRRSDGTYPNHPFNPSNPLQTRDLMTNRETVNRLLASGKLDLNLLQTAHHLVRLTFEGGIDTYGQENRGIFPRELQFERNSATPGTSLLRTSSIFSTNFRNLLVHTFTLPEQSLTFTSQAGWTLYNYDFNSVFIAAQDLIGTQTNVDQAGVQSLDHERRFDRDRGVFFQEEINYADWAILTLGIRGDKSSRNSKVNQFFWYPRAALALVLTDAPFWRWPQINSLKLRLAYGQSGNFPVFGARYTTFENTSIGGNAGIIIAPRWGVTDIRPERQIELEGGVDISFLNERALLEITVYRKQVRDLILNREVELSTGFRLQTFNGGEMVNRGLEMGLTATPLRRSHLSWLTRLNFWLNRAEVTRLEVPPFFAAGFGATLGAFQVEEGKSPTQIVGIDDINGDGVPDGVFQLGDGSPDFQTSLYNDLTLWKQLNITFLLHWKYGGYNLNFTQLLTDLGRTSPDFDTKGKERLARLGVSARQFVQNASYLKLREVGIYYTVPSTFLNRWMGRQVRRMRIGISGRNLITISPYQSYDPEVSNFGVVPIGTGIEVAPYPHARQFFFHLGLEF